MNSIVPLNALILTKECSGLNIAGDGSVSGVFGGGVPVMCQEGDPELIIVVKFRERVSINQIMIEAGMKEESLPDRVKIYSNKADLDFDDVQNIEPTELFNLKQNVGKKLNVKLAKFRNISDISLFFNKEDGKVIQVNNIQFYGVSNEKNVDFGEMKKNPAG